MKDRDVNPYYLKHPKSDKFLVALKFLENLLKTSAAKYNFIKIQASDLWKSEGTRCQLKQKKEIGKVRKAF